MGGPFCFTQRPLLRRHAPSVELALKIAGVISAPLEMVFSLKPFASLAQTIRNTG